MLRDAQAQHRPVVIGIAGPPGAGKTRLAQELAHLLGDASVLSMDHYQRMTDLPPEEIARWAARGADFDALPVPGLAEHLAALRRGQTVVDPTTGAMVPACRFIVFETHFGRAHRTTGPLIDVLVWLDTPVDVALARNLRAFVRPWLQPGAGEAAQAEGLRWIEGYLDNYLSLVAPLLRLQAERVPKDADLCAADGASAHQVLDGVLRLLSSVNR